MGKNELIKSSRFAKSLRAFFVVLVLIGVSMVIYGLFQTKLVCTHPESRVGGKCCVDRNQNSICDDGECLPEVTYGRNASGHCIEFTNTCLPGGFSQVDLCPKPSCFDKIQNCHDDSCETGIDCGGPCTVKVISTCLDGIKNQDEEDVDCGGSCPPCILKQKTPTCFDGTKNQNETGIDCGGPCPPCLPSCFDGVKNQGEEKIDCGGPCPACITQPENKLVWMFNTSEAVYSVSVSNNGSSILVGSGDDYVYALKNDGSLLWRYKTRGSVISVGVADDGYRALVASEDNYVYSFRNISKVLPTTTYYKRYRLGDISAMDVASNGYGVVAGAAYDGNVTDEGSYREDYLYKLNNQAEVVYSYQTKRDVTSVAISPSGNIISGISDDRLFVNGRVIDMGWLYTFDYLEYIDTSDSAIAVGNTNNVYYILSRGSEVEWIYNTTKTMDVSISNNNKILVATHKAIMLDGSMNELWSYDIGHPVLKVEVSRSGNVAVAFFDNRYLYVFDGTGALKWRYFTGDKIISMDISPDDKYIVTGSHRGSVYLFRV
ncbi:MAG: WD40 repeat domain-containing protein [Methanobacteriota archaeon]